MNRKLAVKIAKDVLAQLKARRYVTTNNMYCSINNVEYDYCGNNGLVTDDPDLKKIFNSDSMQYVFKNNEKVICKVCALGAAFTSLINIENKVSVREYIVDDPNFDRLQEIFGQNCFLIEYVFEKGLYGMITDGEEHDFTEKELKLAKMYGRKYKKSEARLQAIMLNIVRNNGQFKLPAKVSS